MKKPPSQQKTSGCSMLRLVNIIFGESRTRNIVTETSANLGDRLIEVSHKVDKIGCEKQKPNQ